MREASRRVPFTFRIALALSLLFVLSNASAAERLPIRTYTTADGLPRDHIFRIVQDSRGFLWFCTSEGLARFDGYKFTNYGIEQGLAGRQVVDFLETRNGSYWAATDKGLCRFNPDGPALTTPDHDRNSSQKFIPYYAPETELIVSICEDQAGTIWCGTMRGLFRLDQINGDWVFSVVDIVRPFSATDSLLVRHIIEDRQGTLWIAAESALYRRWPDGRVERYSTEEGLPADGDGRALLEDRDGTIWLGTASGLYQLVANPGPHRSVVAHKYTTGDGLVFDAITSLCQSSDGKLWIGTNQGLTECVLAGDRPAGPFRSYTQANGLSDSEVTDLSEDRYHNLWIASDSGGAMRLASNGFTTYDESDGLGGIRTRVSSIFEDRAGDLCVVVGNNCINRFDGRKFVATELSPPKGFVTWGWGWNQIILQDHLGEWWIPAGEGLIRYSKSNVDQLRYARPKAIYTMRDGLPANNIFRLFEDSRGDIWVSTLGNDKGVLTRWERATQSFHVYSPAIGIPEAAPTAFCEDGAGNLWIGFYNGGLLRYAAGRFTGFLEGDGVPPGLVRQIHLDHAGRLWIATGEGGVARVDDPNAERPSFHAYSTADGLSSNQATCLIEDERGVIYVGTGRGVDELDPSTGQVKHYTPADGLANSFINVGFRQRDGSLWFGTLQGLSRHLPHPERPTSPPPVFINSLHIAGVTYPLSELGATNLAVPELGASQNNVEIEFGGLSLATGESLRYQYKLEGASSDWSVPAFQRQVNYPNLAPGYYRFLVRAVSADGIPSESPAAVSFRILPPIWQRWWFRFLGLLLIAIPAAVVARSRHQRLKVEREAEQVLRKSREERLIELEQVRRRIATDLHDDVGSSLSQIYLLSEVARQRVRGDESEVIEPLSMISSTAHEMVNSMSDIVWAINPHKDHLSDLVSRMRRFASDTLSARDIAFRFSAPDEESDIRLGANLRREVFLIFKESINNLVKHSRCSEAEIEFRNEEGALMLRVHDNGRGFDPDLVSDGHGLASIRERAASVGGALELVSNQGRGATITLNVPTGPLRPPDPANNGG